MINKALRLMEELFSGEADPVEFSVSFADFCFDINKIFITY